MRREAPKSARLGGGILSPYVLAVAASFAVLPACGNSDMEAPDAAPLGPLVGDFAGGGCSTSVVLGLSLEIADEISCIDPEALDNFEPSARITFSGGAVLPYLSRAAIADLLAATAEDVVPALEANSSFRTVAQQYLLAEWFSRGLCGITAGDEVHFDHLGSPDRRGLDVQAFQRLWNRNTPGDTLEEDGIYGPATLERLGRARQTALLGNRHAPLFCRDATWERRRATAPSILSTTAHTSSGRYSPAMSAPEDTWFKPSSSQTVVVPDPDPLRDVFDAARENVRKYFTSFVADPATGQIEVSDDRYLLVRASALSTDFLDTMVQLYDDRELSEAQEIGRAHLFDIAHTIGKNDARSFHKKMGLTDPFERLAAGPVQFAYCGWAKVDFKGPTDPSIDQDFQLFYDHPYSFEADTWIRSGRSSDQPVCIMGAGYSSGWSGESFGLELTAVEISCRARGDDACSFIMAPPGRIRERLREHLGDASEDVVIPSFFARKREEDALRRSERRLASMLAATPVPVLIAASDGELLFSNVPARELFGERLAERRRLHNSELFDNPGELERLLAVVDQGEKVVGEEHAMLDASGSRFFALVSCHSLLLPDGESGFVLTTLDVTEYKRTETRLRVNQRMATVGTLAAGVAHEINNPLAYVLANLEHAAQLLATQDNGRISGAIAKALEGAQRVRGIVRDLQSLSRDEGESSEAVILEEVLDRAIAVAEVTWRHHAHIKRDYGGDTLALADGARLGQVFINLIINAAHAFDSELSEENEIQVTTTQNDDSHVEVRVHDTGRGIAEANLERLFDPFYTTKQIGEGTGLGLAIAKSIIENLAGTIEVSSDVGVGTTVVVKLPCAQERPRQPSYVTSPSIASVDGLRLLIVDDETDLTEILAEMLDGADVEVAHSGRCALELIADREFDVVLCDLMMPDVTGMELFRRVTPSTRKKLIFMTGGVFTTDAAAFVAELKNPCLEKPVPLDELRQTIAAHAQSVR